MKRFALLFLLVVLAAPGAFACDICDNGTCVFGLPSGWFCQMFPRGGCINDGFCPDGVQPLQAEYRVAAVRVIEQGKPLPPPKNAPKAAPVLAAAK